MLDPGDIRNFDNYRLYLRAQLQRIQHRNPSFSLGAFARALQLKDTSSISKILQGKRSPGPGLIEKLSDFFKLDRQQSQYFRTLVELEKKKNGSVHLLLKKELNTSRIIQDTLTITERQFLLVSNWFTFVIREMPNLKDFSSDFSWMSRRIRKKIKATQLEEAVENLLFAGLLKRNADGKLEIPDSHFQTAPDVPAEAVKQYHESMLLMAHETVRSVGVEDRELSATTFPMKLSDIPAAKAMIRDFRERFIRTFETGKADEIYQFQMQLFPMTQSFSKTSHKSSQKKESP